MGYEKVKKITFNKREQKVYITSKASNDNAPYSKWESKFFTKMWEEHGRLAVEIAIVKLYLGGEYQSVNYSCINLYDLASLEYNQPMYTKGYCEQEIKRSLEYVANYKNVTHVLGNDAGQYIMKIDKSGASVTSDITYALKFSNKLKANAANNYRNSGIYAIAI